MKNKPDGKHIEPNSPSNSSGATAKKSLPTRRSAKRRQLVKSLAAGGGIVASTGISQWRRPMVQSTILPAHAEASPNGGSNGRPPSCGGISGCQIVVTPNGESTSTVTGSTVLSITGAPFNAAINSPVVFLDPACTGSVCMTVGTVAGADGGLPDTWFDPDHNGGSPDEFCVPIVSGTAIFPGTGSYDNFGVGTGGDMGNTPANADADGGDEGLQVTFDYQGQQCVLTFGFTETNDADPNTGP